MRLSSHRPLTLFAVLATAALAAAEVPPPAADGASQGPSEQTQKSDRRSANRQRATTGERTISSGSVDRWFARVQERRAIQRAPAFGGAAPR